MVPQFPEFKLIDLDDKPALDDYLRRYPPLASEYTFTNIFAWREIYHYQLAEYRGGFLIRRQYRDRLSFLQPLVPDDAVGAVQTCFAYLSAQGHAPCLERVGEDFVAQADWAQAGIRADRDDFDYIYDVRELIDLKGKKFHDKKNLLNKFTKNYAYDYVPLTEELIQRCIEFQHEWCIEKNCERYEDLSHEHCAVIQMLRNYFSLSVCGSTLLVNDQVVAFSIGERLNPDTLVIHVEKAQEGLTGVYQAMTWEFLRHEAGGCTFVNREQDLGDEGLRKAKLSYNPVRMGKKYVLAPVEMTG